MTNKKMPNPGNAVAEAVEPVLGLRVGDGQRDEVQTLLGQALALGYLSIEEFDERSGRAMKATTGADLAAVSGDLPVEDLRRLDPVQQSSKNARARRELRVHGAVIVAVIVTTVLAWLIGGVATAAWYPWPLWPVLGGVASWLFHAGPVLAAKPGSRA